MDRKNIDKISADPQDRLLLAKLYDKLNAGIRKNIPANGCFLSPREQQLCRYLFDSTDSILLWGGYPDAERKMPVYLPDYLSEAALMQEESPIVCLRAAFYREETPSHRDFLGALMGLGVARQTIGDIMVANGSCDFFIASEIAPFVLQNFTSAGRTHLSLSRICLQEVNIPQQQYTEIHDTVASVRLDSILSAGFRISRTLAGEYIAAGRVSIDGLPCEKSDKLIAENAKLSIRGMGKIKLSEIGHTTKKGRIAVTIHRYQ